MPRANRHFLPSHIWHITHRAQESLFQSFQSFNRFAPFKPLSRETDKIPLLRNARSAPLFALDFRGKKTLRSVRAQLMVTCPRLLFRPTVPTKLVCAYGLNG